ncbi:MAG: response regulator [Dehalococcoidales bacterium]|nr:response regulator [Dehalococcoidales bacterium]
MDRILIVDDDESTRHLLKTLLSSAGYEVLEAINGEQGFGMALDKKPALIITDVMMPIKSGYELAHDLRSNRTTASVPIIMLTALSEEQDELKAFQEGIDDYLTKPFSPSVLRARVAALLVRSRAMHGKLAAEPSPSPEPKGVVDRISCGDSQLDEALGGGLPQGSNILVVGETGSGKSSLCRRFLATGLKASECCMVITLDDAPTMIRRSLDMMLPKPVSEYEGEGNFCLVDGYGWSRGNVRGTERFAVSGLLELNQLAGLISDAGMELGQSVGGKAGGRRILDSITSLFTNFELALVQRLIAQLTRTATSYGGVATLYVVEEGAISEQTLNNMKYVMDGLIQLRMDNTDYYARVANMKWSKFSREWLKLGEQSKP